MRKVIYSMMVSLDGFIAGPNQEADWIQVDEELHTFVNERERAIDTHLYGRRMYEVMSYWQTADTNLATPAFERDYAQIWQGIQKVVFSTTLDRVEGKTRLARGDVGAEIAALKAQPGKDIGVAGATLAATVIALGLVDQYQLFVQPAILGGGTPYWPPAHRCNLQLVETHQFRSGVAMLHYQTLR